MSRAGLALKNVPRVSHTIRAPQISQTRKAQLHVSNTVEHPTPIATQDELSSMQKLFQRAELAKRQAATKLKKAHEKKEVEQKYRRRQEAIRVTRLRNDHIREARRVRKEDWAQGSLAPRRDVGDQAETYATISVYDMRLPEVRPAERIKWKPIRPGDRVAVIRGKNAGSIGVVDAVDEERNSVKIEDVNVHDVNIPDWMPREEGDQRRVVPASIPLPIEDVRLVFPLPHPETGIPQDTVIDRLVPKFPDDASKRNLKDANRVIAGTNTVIPWPLEADPDEEVYEVDTLSSDVEQETFRIPLLHPPMPMSVIDELRNKYSKFRTRHDYEYLQKKQREDELAERRDDLSKTMRTPLQELAELRARKKAAEARELSSTQLAKIGEVIALERAKAADAVRRIP